MGTETTQPPLIVHVIYRLGIGGLENGLINLINQLPPEAYRHAIVCLTDSTNFKTRLTRNDVDIYHLNKKAGQDWMSFIRFYQLLRRIRPNIVHTRNLTAIEYQVSAWLAGVKHRAHGEHGWDVFDPDGSNVKYQWIRRLLKPLIQRFIPLSKHLECYLTEKILVSPKKITRICNGVDTSIFYPLTGNKAPLTGCPFSFSRDQIVLGTVGRMHGVKDQLTLIKAFIWICLNNPKLKDKLRLVIAGDGPLKAQAIKLLEENRLTDLGWLPGERSDVAEIMRRLDIFILPSQAEGISNTILEAMATGLPVIATHVGGNPELVVDGKTGSLVAAGDPLSMAHKLMDYIGKPEIRCLHGQNGYQLVLEQFSLGSMVAKYQAVYDSLLNQKGS